MQLREKNAEYDFFFEGSQKQGAEISGFGLRSVMHRADFLGRHSFFWLKKGAQFKLLCRIKDLFKIKMCVAEKKLRKGSTLEKRLTL